jgi:phytoene desaturase
MTPPRLDLSSLARKPGRPGLRAAVIGSGFGGLAAAIRLQAMGFQTTIYEARDKPGGRAYVYEDQGYTFDAGPTVITAPECIDEVFAAANRKTADYVEMLPVTPFYKLLWHDGDSIDYVGDSEHMVAQIRARNPKDAEGYLKFVAYSRKVFDKSYTELAATPFLRFSDMVKVAPDLAKLRADRSVYKTVARYVKDEHVRQALSFHSLLVGGNPFDTSAIYTLIHYLERNWGVFFPRGGTGALVRALVRVFEETGGTMHLCAPVDSVSVREERGQAIHRLTARGQSPADYDIVVSNADLHHTYASIYGAHPGAAPMRKWLERAQWSMSLFVLYFGTDNIYDDIEHHTVIFGPRYKGLLTEIFKGKRLPEDFSLYLHAPTKTDPALAPPGCSTFYVLSPVPHLGRAGIDWDQEGEAYADRILEALEQHMPDLRQHVVTKRWFTPKEFKTELRSFHGSAFSVAPILRQSAWFRPHNRDPRIPGLYIVGAGTHPGAGLPGVINSAKATVSCVASDFAGRVPA